MITLSEGPVSVQNAHLERVKLANEQSKIHQKHNTFNNLKYLLTPEISIRYTHCEIEIEIGHVPHTENGGG